MKKLFILLAMELALTTTAIAATERTAPRQSLDTIIAIVEEDVITQSELDKKLSQIKQQLAMNNTPLPDDHLLEKQTIDHMINERLALQIAKRAGVQVDDKMLNDIIKRIAQQNNATVAQFRQTLENDGLAFDDFKADLRNELIVTRTQQRAVASRINVSDREIDEMVKKIREQSAATEEYHLGHILLSLPDNPSSSQIIKTKQKAEEIIAELNNGKNFAQMAASYSSSPQALKGGDLGWGKLAELPTVFSPVVPTMKVNGVAGPIRTPNGFHIIKLIDVRNQESKHEVVQSHVRHILISPNEVLSDADAKLRLEELRTRIEKGANFGDLARAHSDDMPTANKGGDLGWLEPGPALDKKFVMVMSESPVGRLSQPFRSEFGWHILEVVERRTQDGTEQFQREKARQYLENSKYREALQTWVNELRDSAHVEVRADLQ
jgi:peptidyl-prolyl cis-trans isomerase SurA